ncbi:MAG: 50S ribosomal protein L29 [Kiritimatiellia bacterium]
MNASEIKELTGEELAQRKDDARKELFNLRLQQTGGQLEKPSRIRDIRRDIARMNTEARKRQKVSR